MTSNVKLNSAGVGALAKSGGVRALVDDAADRVAANVRDLGIGVGDRDGGPREVALPVRVTLSTTDRAVASVTLTHPAGIAVQAKHGALTKAASAAGLSVADG